MVDQLRLVRVVLTDRTDRNNLLRVDLLISGETIKRGIEYFGLWKQGLEFYPFLLSSVGNIGFGDGYGDDDRVYESNILQKRIIQGEMATSKNRSDGAYLRYLVLLDFYE